MPTADGSAVPDDAYLQAYVRRWCVQILALFATLILILAMSTAVHLFGHETNLPKNALNPAVPAFVIALCVCNVAIVRYSVTYLVLKRLPTIDRSNTRFEEGQE